MSEKERDAIFAKWNSKKLVAHVGNEPQRSKTKTMSPLKPSRLQAPAPRAVSAPYVFPVSAQAPAPAPDKGLAPVEGPSTAPDLGWAALDGQSGPFMFGRGRARLPPQASASEPPQVGAREESRSGGVEATAPEGTSYGLYPPRQVPESEDSGEESGVESLSNPLEAGATPQEWGDSMEPEGAGEAGWVTKPVRKRALSGEHEEARGRKEAPSIPLDPNPFQESGVGGGEASCVGAGAAVSEGAPPTAQDPETPQEELESHGHGASWGDSKDPGDGIDLAFCTDIDLPSPALLPDCSEEQMEQMGGEGWDGKSQFRVVNVYAPAQRGRRLEVFRDLPGCLSTTRSLILGGDFNVTLDTGRARVGLTILPERSPSFSEDFSLVDAFRATHPTDSRLHVAGRVVEAAKSRFVTFCRRHAVVAPGGIGQGWPGGWHLWLISMDVSTASQWTGPGYEGAKERSGGLLEARAKPWPSKLQLRELEEGRACAYFFQAAGRVSASAIMG
ncbi:hypothetical protein AAFF_G00409170 [Aldrovandia affinis]|uniref:Endonuclease/exonuclease/phosphatase domain-containing protein n=1 Tax=Aldrovandia affinis TaxID=143900 RepID=A0AAD7R444_9TELE|nr:hypothetical protein AAFF_G00409170 [Aldrovandia affinis]